MKLAISLVFILCSFFGGYFAATSYHSVYEKDIEAELKNPAEKGPASFAYAMNLMNETSHVSTPSQKKFSTPEEAIDQIPRNAHELSLKQALGGDAMGIRIEHVLRANRYAKLKANEIPDAEKLLPKLIDDLRQDPQIGIAQIVSALDRLPAMEFPEEQAALFQILNQALGPSDEIKTLALTSLTQNSIPARSNASTGQTDTDLDQTLSTTAQTNLPIILHQIYLQNLKDPNEAMNGTINGIVAQPDTGVRVSIAAQFVQLYPNLRKDLVTALHGRGIPPPIDAR